MASRRSGLAKTTLIRARSIVSNTPGPSGLSGTTTDPPTNKVGSTVTPRPPIRVNGAAARVTSVGANVQAATIWTTPHSTLACDNITPLGAPVVPEV